MRTYAMLLLLGTVVVSLFVVAFAACGGSEERATQTPATPAATGTPSESSSSATATATTTPVVAATGSEFSGSATVSVKVGDKTSTLENGTCTKGPDDAWLGVSVGEVGNAEHFLLLVGNLTGQEDARSAKGGGVFTDGEITTVAGAQGGTTFALLLSEEAEVTVTADLKSGEFVGTTTEGEPMSGSFRC